ncbi:MAG: dihydroneopterin aldolase [Bdellovibrionota bacterium]
MLWSKDEKPIVNSLRINDLSLQVRIGCTEEERAQPQEVRVSIEMRFPQLPVGAVSDLLNDTICYAKVSEAIKEHCEKSEYKLIERMALDCLQILRPFSESKAQVGLMVHKVKPPIPSLLGGTTYRCGDFYL